MSYILEALKKSEQERNRAAVPNLQTAARMVHRKRSLWAGIAIGASALAMIVVVAWFVDPRWLLREASLSAISEVDTGAAHKAIAGARERPRERPVARVEPPAARTAPPPAVEAGKATGSIRVTRLDQMDPAARARVKDLTLNAVSYSDAPKRRFVMLNQRIVHESEILANGVVVKRILPHGVLLEVGKFEFRLRL